MNKKISTLLAAALVAGSMSVSAQLVAVGSAAAGAGADGSAATFVPGDYYYLKANAAGIGQNNVRYLAYLKGNVTADSLGVVKTEQLNTSEETNRALWKVIAVKDPVTGKLSYWTFENKQTGTLLAEGSVNAFEWIAEGEPAQSQAVSATRLSSGQGLDLDKGEHYVFKEVITLLENSEFKGSADGSSCSIDDLLKDKKFSRSLQLVKFVNRDMPDVDWDNKTVVNANKSVKAYITTGKSDDKIAEVAKDVKLTFNAGTKIVLNTTFSTKSGNSALLITPMVPGFDITMDEDKFAGLINPKKFTSFKFTGMETTGTNVLATNEFEYVELPVAGYSNATNVGANQNNITITVLRAKAKDAKGRAQYLRVDTAKFAGGDYFKLKLDTMTTNANGGLIAAPKAVMQSYAFGIAYDYAADSVSIYPKFTLDKASATANWSDSTTVTIATNDASGNVLAIKQFSTAKELTVVPVAEVSAKAKYTFGDITPGGGVAAFEDGASYYIQRANKAENVANGKFYANSFYGDAQYMDSAYYLPATQWTVKEVANGTYTIKNRETGETLDGVNDAGSILYTAEEGAVALSNGDTVKFIAAPAQADNKYLGYLNLKEEDYRNNAYSISFTDYNDITTYVNTEDSVLKASDEGVYFKLSPVPAIEKGFGADTLVRSAYYISDREGKKFIAYNDAKTGYKLSETAEPVKFLFRNVGAETYSLIDSVAALDESKELIIDIKSGAVRPVKVGSAVTNNAFDILVEPAPEYVLNAKGHYNIENLRGDMLAADANGFGMFRKEGELKAAYEKADFALFIDTAKIHAIEPSYFILSGAKAEKGTSVLEGNFLRVMSDSIDVEGYKAANGLVRLAFVPAKRFATSDSLLVNYQNEEFTKKDSVGYKGKQAGIDQFQFKIQYTNTDGEYIVENAAGYLATYNDVLCLTSAKTDSQLIKLTSAEAPTANEGVELSEVKVIAGEGQVTIAGAAGKKVVVSNILGQVVANTVITSSDAVIAAPQGVVVVAVEGEEAVKAIVK
ncbi:DUF6383 domain-containing protein [Parabacteroides johnsonii]|uniref:DUF6383 domain-containing protein n=1 Tax=Parabacteroides johnsonii TaxID=387661 RepID=UPI0011DDFC2D|nr:DUF6383 domain-containing protein [Parabacteroides johnsonii]